MQGTLEDVYVRMFCAHAPRHAPLVWGNPPFRVRFVRLSGVVVARERTSLTLDDSTGLACVRYGDSAELQRTAATLELGAPIDVLGGLVVDTGGVCVDAIAIVSRADDALAEVVTALETMDAYRHYYRYGGKVAMVVAAVIARTLTRFPLLNQRHVPPAPGSGCARGSAAVAHRQTPAS